MDLYVVLAHLAAERKRVDDLIQALEALQNGHPAQPALGTQSRRGRKFMSAEERQEVSRRMQRYWEAKRSEQNAKKGKDASSG